MAEMMDNVRRIPDREIQAEMLRAMILGVEMPDHRLLPRFPLINAMGRNASCVGGWRYLELTVKKILHDPIKSERADKIEYREAGIDVLEHTRRQLAYTQMIGHLAPTVAACRRAVIPVDRETFFRTFIL